MKTLGQVIMDRKHTILIAKVESINPVGRFVEVVQRDYPDMDYRQATEALRHEHRHAIHIDILTKENRS